MTWQIFTSAWQEVLHQLPNRCILKSAAEIACGGFPKAGLAVQQLFPDTKIFYIDTCATALEHCKERLHACLPTQSASFLQYSLDDHSIPMTVDLILGNHVLDDILLRHYLHQINAEITDPYHSPDFYLKTVSDVILYYTKNTHAYVEKLLDTFDYLLNPQGLILLSDYTSYYETFYKLTERPHYRFNLLEKMTGYLHQKGYTQFNPNLPDVFSHLGAWMKS